VIARVQLICVGRGFDWLALPNKAIVIGPFRCVVVVRDVSLFNVLVCVSV
jgi:hypothetical protein